MESDEDLIKACIEYYSQDQTPEFQKYWKNKQAPWEEVWDLILTDPDRAAKIIDKIAKAASGNWKIQNQLNCGLMWSFRNHTGEEYFERIEKKK